jgi:hypothetical protein
MSNLPASEPITGLLFDSKNQSDGVILNVTINQNIKSQLNRFFYRFDEVDFINLTEILKTALNKIRLAKKPIQKNETEFFVEFKNTGMLFIIRQLSVRFINKTIEENYYFDLNYIENQSYY